MIPGIRVLCVIACIASTACTVTRSEPVTTDLTISLVHDDDNRLLAVSCLGTNAGRACPVEIDRGEQRQVLSIPVGKTVAFSDRPKDARVCFARMATEAGGCPVVPPPPPPPPPPPRRS
jgi:hypothetical protein